MKFVYLVYEECFPEQWVVGVYADEDSADNACTDKLTMHWRKVRFGEAI